VTLHTTHAAEFTNPIAEKIQMLVLQGSPACRAARAVRDEHPRGDTASLADYQRTQFGG